MPTKKFTFETVSDMARIEGLINFAASFYGVQAWSVERTVLHLDVQFHTYRNPIYYFQVVVTDDDPGILGCMELFLTGLFGPREYEHRRGKWSIPDGEWMSFNFVHSRSGAGRGQK